MGLINWGRLRRLSKQGLSRLKQVKLTRAVMPSLARKLVKRTRNTAKRLRKKVSDRPAARELRQRLQNIVKPAKDLLANHGIKVVDVQDSWPDITPRFEGLLAKSMDWLDNFQPF